MHLDQVAPRHHLEVPAQPVTGRVAGGPLESQPAPDVRVQAVAGEQPAPPGTGRGHDAGGVLTFDLDPLGPHLDPEVGDPGCQRRMQLGSPDTEAGTGAKPVIGRVLAVDVPDSGERPAGR